MKQKFAFFDFDDTLIHGDSNVYLLKYYLKKHPLSFFRFIPVGFYGFLYFLHLIPINKAKNAWLFPLGKMTKEEIKKFYDQHIASHYYSNVIQELKEKKAAGYLIYIVSASVEQYLNCNELPVDKVLGTKLKEVNGRYINEMIGLNCKGKEKVHRILNDLKEKGYQIDYDNSFAYSDSNADIPMLKLVKNRIRINKKNGAMTPFEIEG